MWIKNIFYGILIFSVVFLGYLTIQNDITKEYGVSMAENNSESFNKVDKSLSLVRNMSDTMYNAQHEDTSAFYMMSKQVVQTIRMLFNLPEIIINVLSYIGEEIGVPAWIIGAGIAAIIITIVLYIIGIFAKVSWGN